MLKRFTITAGLFLLATNLAVAQTAAPDSAAAPAPIGVLPTAGSPNSDMKDWQVAKMVPVGLAQAIGTAEAQGDEKGGRAIDADFKKVDGKDPSHYSIKVVYPSGKLVEYGINAETGALYKTENQPIERYFTFLTPANFNEAKVSLKDALALAEQKAGGGKAYEAEVSKDGKAVQYQIKVAGLDKEINVKIGADGTVID